jgi:hypothetical protein
MKRTMFRAIQLAGVAFALALLVLASRAAWSEAAAADLRFRAGTASLAVGSLFLTLLGVIALWRLLLADLGVALGYGPAVQLWSFSNLGRYLPGKLWQVVGLVVVSRDLGAPPGVTVTGGVLALGLMIGTGAAVGLLTLPEALRGLGWASILVAGLAGALAVPAVWPGVIGWGVRRLPASLGCAGTRPLGRRTWLRLVGLFVLAWIAHGASFLQFASAFGDVRWTDLPACTGAYVLAHVTGLVAVFAPGGIGVREGLLARLLASDGPVGLPAHAVAVAARLWSIAAELLVLALAVGLRVAGRRARP